MLNNEKYSPGASVTTAGHHLHVFLNRNANVYASRFETLNVPLFVA